MNSKIILKINQLEEALNRFKEVLNVEPQPDYLTDAAIQRFEFCYELIWKTIKMALLLNGVEANSPKDVFKKAFQYNYIKNLDLWVNIIDFRNLTTHTYDQILAEEVFEQLPDYVELFSEVLLKLKKEFINE